MDVRFPAATDEADSQPPLVAKSDDDQPARLLIVEERRAQSGPFQAVRDQGGYAIFSAWSAEEALALFVNEPPDLILLTHALPTSDGFANCERIRRNPAWREIPILLVVADRQDMLPAFKLGVQEVLAVPLDDSELLGRIANCLRLKRSCDALRFHNKQLELALAADRKRLQALHQQIALEKFVAALSQRFLALAPEEIDEGIQFALQQIGELAEVDRSYLFRFSDDHQYLTNTHEWCAPGVAPQIHNLLQASRFPWAVELIQQRSILHIPRVAELPPEAAAEKVEFQAESIQSLLLVPLVIERAVVGFLGFDSVRTEKNWSQENISLLQIVGGIIAAACERKQRKESLRLSEQRYRRIAANLPNGVLCQFVLHPDGSLTVPYISPRSRELFEIEAEELMRNPSSGAATIHAEDQAAFYHSIRASAQLSQGGSPWQWEGRIVTPSGKLKWIQGVSQPERQTDGSILWDGIFIDITEKKRIEQALRESEQRYRGLVESQRDLLVRIDAEGRFIFVNNAYCQKFKRRREDVLGVPVIDLTHEDNKAQQLEVWRLLQAPPYRVAFEQQALLAEGQPWIEWEAYAIRDQRGQMIEFQAVGRDVTDRKQVEAALRESEERYRTLVENITDVFFTIDEAGQISYASPGIFALSGYTPEEIVGRPFADFIWPEDLPLVGEAVQNVYSGVPTPGVEIRAITKSGEIRWIRAAAHLASRAEEKSMLQGIITDITERKQAEAKQAALFVELEKSRDDLLLILNQLRSGVVMTDRDGRITFLSQTAQHLLDQTQAAAQGKPWEQVCPFQEQDKAALQAMMARQPEQRTKIPVYTETPAGRYYWMEVDIQDDPRDPLRKIFFLYDISELHDLRLLLDEKAAFQDLVGRSEPMLQVYEQIREVAKVDATVLIEGETGTGKELVARAIHFSSHRQDKPFVAVNCAGLTESLLNSQLFGHRRGAFTGAFADQRGLFEEAHGGTIFLDEIGDIPASVQTSLLRVLQEGEILRLGDSRPRKLDVRVLAATHHNLVEDVATGRFRADLLYRIRVARIQLPPLRERREDIPLLVNTFLARCRATFGKAIHGVSPSAMELLLTAPWPGNVRELKSTLEFAAIRCKGTVIDVVDLPPEYTAAVIPTSLFAKTAQSERQQIRAALEQARGSRVKAAQLLGISRATLYRRLAHLDLQSQP